jgi:MoaA/NifB/PqqE/SkfB family radical SAM enzyme
MRISTRNYWVNLVKLLRGERLLRPLAVVYYVTTRCNLNCVYCEDFGARRNAQAETPLSLDDAVRVLRVVRGGVDHLILSGGEPLLYPDIADLVHRARRELNFRQLTLLTNGLLLPQFEAMLHNMDRLIVSLDATDPDAWSHVIQGAAGAAQTILDNVRTYARRQGQEGYRLIVNCVLTPETLASAQQVLDLCVAHDVLVSFSPQAVHNWPRYELLVSDSYKTFLTRLVDLKRRGAPILGSIAYLHTLHDMVPYTCYPTLLPRIMPNGDLVYPCWPVEKEKGEHGGRPCNLLQTASWEQALDVALDAYGPPPRMCTSCFQQCFAEPSLMQTRPLSLLHEWLRYAPSRQGAIWTHSPG